MSATLLTKTVLDTYQDSLALDERRYEKNGVIKSFHESTKYVDYVSPSIEEIMRTASSERAFDIPVIKSGDAIATLTPGFDAVIENGIESDTFRFVAVDVATSIEHYPVNYAENIINGTFAKNTQIKRALKACTELAEEACLSVLNNNRTQFLNYIDQANTGDGTYAFDGTNKLLTMNKAALKGTPYYDLQNLAMNNLIDEEIMLLTSKGGTNEIVRQMLSNGGANSINKSWASDLIEKGNIFESHKIDPDGDILNGFVIGKGSVGIYPNHPFDCVNGTVVGTKEWSVSNLELEGMEMKANIIIDRSAVDARAKTGRGSNALMTHKESMIIWFRFYLTFPYNSSPSTNISPIIKLKATV